MTMFFSHDKILILPFLIYASDRRAWPPPPPAPPLSLSLIFFFVAIDELWESGQRPSSLMVEGEEEGLFVGAAVGRIFYYRRYSYMFTLSFSKKEAKELSTWFEILYVYLATVV